MINNIAVYNNYISILRINNHFLSINVNLKSPQDLSQSPFSLQKSILRFNISDSYAMIDGSEERHVKAGSHLHLVCRVHDSSGPPNYVYWYRDDVVVNYSGRKGIHIWTGDAVPNAVDKSDDDDDVNNVTTTVTSTTLPDDGGHVTEGGHGGHVTRSKSRRKTRIRPIVVSMLEIQTVMPDDAGTYTCAPSNARNRSAVVHVIQGNADWIVKHVVS